MKYVRLVLPLIPLILLLGATCVTETEQRGPMGPWVGEVVNTGPEPVHEVGVSANIFDATGRHIGPFIVPTCPPSLLPGERGTFETFFWSSQAVVPPLRAEFQSLPPSIAGLGPWGDGAGLSVRLLQTYPEHRAVVAEVRNDSGRTYNLLTVCGNLRTPDGKLTEVGNATPFPYLIRPGETRTFSMFFNSMPEGSFEFFARGRNLCCDEHVILDSSVFRISATRVVEGPGGREIQVVGEFRNRDGQDLSGIELQAYIEESPWARVRAEVGCNGIVGFGKAGPAMFTLPLEQGADPSVVIVGIEGTRASENLYPIPVGDVSKEGVPGSQSVRVSATLTNPTDSFLHLKGVCLNLRGRDGHLVGMLSLDPAYYLQPGGSMKVSGEVAALEKAASAEVIAYGHPSASTPPMLIIPQAP